MLQKLNNLSLTQKITIPISIIGFLVLGSISWFPPMRFLKMPRSLH